MPVAMLRCQAATWQERGRRRLRSPVTSTTDRKLSHRQTSNPKAIIVMRFPGSYNNITIKAVKIEGGSREGKRSEGVLKMRNRNTPTMMFRSQPPRNMTGCQCWLWLSLLLLSQFCTKTLKMYQNSMGAAYHS